ncbi:predicted transcriptional regulator [Paenibacillus popilliae ATCC 14706]|uniref:Predicted transcriptional regulator n=1 Tax=Paenibacillus popilliae ATCC 14706 TaxID=1212764 RepID=M9LHE8_PAEPP|nr:predicted transcriptional regulator [Paenibacillus popilliae ATCC 14706]
MEWNGVVTLLEEKRQRADMNSSGTSKDDVCDIVCYDSEKIRKLQGRVQEEEVQGMAQMFKALSDPTRMKMAWLLDEGGELCVCDMSILTKQSIATASHHLRLMKSLGIATSRKEGKNVFYSLADHHIRTLIRMTLEHMREEHCHEDTGAGENRS